MMMSNRIDVFLCTCNNLLSNSIDFSTLSSIISKRKASSSVTTRDCLCDERGLSFLAEHCKRSKPDGVVIGACANENITYAFKLSLEEVGISPFFLEIVPLRELCALVHKDKVLATRKAAFLMLSKISKVEIQKSPPPESIKLVFSKPKAIDRRTFLRLLSRGFTEQRILPFINQRLCLGSKNCQLCIKSCPFVALSISAEIGIPTLDSDRCQSCGLCIPSCPTGAIELLDFTDEQIIAQVEALSICDSIEPKVVAFVCNQAWLHLNSIGEKGIEYPPNILPIDVPCIGFLTVPLIIYTFNRGADWVLMIRGPCHRCSYKLGGGRGGKTVAMTNKLLRSYGIESRVEILQISDAKVEEFIASLENLKKRASSISFLSEEKAPFVKGHHDQMLSLINILSRKSMPKAGLIENPYFGIIKVDKEKCTFCSVCMQYCPTKALKCNIEGEYATLTFDHSQCVGCELCKIKCPEGAIDLEKAIDVSLLHEKLPCTLIKSEVARCSQCGRPMMSSPMFKKVEEVLTQAGFPPMKSLRLCPECKHYSLIRETLGYTIRML